MTIPAEVLIGSVVALMGGLGLWVLKEIFEVIKRNSEDIALVKERVIKLESVVKCLEKKE